MHSALTFCGNFFPERSLGTPAKLDFKISLKSTSLHQGTDISNKTHHHVQPPIWGTNLDNMFWSTQVMLTAT